MKPVARGSLVAGVHLALLGIVGAVLLYERETLPAVWAATAGVDPVLPIRGRYVALNLVVEPRGELPRQEVSGVEDCGDALPPAPPDRGPPIEATLGAEDGRLVATILPPADDEAMIGWRGHIIRPLATPQGHVWILDEPIAFFVPESAPDPTRLQQGEVLWARVTVPRRGLPRPIRLEVRDATGARPPDQTGR